MGLFFKAHRKHVVPRPHRKASRSARSRLHICRFEQMEPRQLLSVTARADMSAPRTTRTRTTSIQSSYRCKGTTPKWPTCFSQLHGRPAGTQLTQ